MVVVPRIRRGLDFLFHGNAAGIIAGLIAGLIARRIVPFIAQNDPVLRGERVSLIQFGSRVDVYLPKHAKVKVKLGDRVVGGESILAAIE